MTKGTPRKRLESPPRIVREIEDDTYLMEALEELTDTAPLYLGTTAHGATFRVSAMHADLEG